MKNKLPAHKAYRYNKTLTFLKKTLPAPATILDLGIRNDFSEIMEQNGYTVYNTQGEDFDLNPEVVKGFKVDAVTSFEVFEHLVAPFNILREIECKTLITSVPLKLWFASAYRSSSDMWDRHYHEFEDWQFDWLLEKSGWNIIEKEKWTSPVRKLGIRPMLRKFTPRYYVIHAERTTQKSNA